MLGDGWPEQIPATSMDRQCGSSQQAAHFAAQSIMADVQDVVTACGVESMSRVPMGMAMVGRDPLGPKVAARYPEGLVNQGVSAELIAAKWGFSRSQLDDFAARSHELAARAASSGAFDNEIVPVSVTGADGAMSEVRVDETVRAGTTAEGLSGLKPSFATEELAARFPRIEWQITPGNSSPLSDGASAALIMSADRAKQLSVA